MNTISQIVDTIAINQGGLRCNVNNKTGNLTYQLEQTGVFTRVKLQHPGFKNNTSGPFSLNDPVPKELNHIF